MSGEPSTEAGRALLEQYDDGVMYDPLATILAIEAEAAAAATVDEKALYDRLAGGTTLLGETVNRLRTALAAATARETALRDDLRVAEEALQGFMVEAVSQADACKQLLRRVEAEYEEDRQRPPSFITMDLIRQLLWVPPALAGLRGERP